jgi:hypothetical protein
MWQLAGASAIFASSPLERRFRDIHVVTQHAAVGTTQYDAAGRLVLGLDDASGQSPVASRQ